MERKILIISVFITLGVVAFMSGYLLMSPGNPSDQTGSIIGRFNDAPTETSGDETDKILPVSIDKFLSFVNPFSNTGKIIAGDKNGNIVEIDVDSLKETALATLKHKNISDIVLSPSGDAAVYSFYDARNNRKNFYFDFKKKEASEITGELISTAFSPSGDQAAYLLKKKAEGELLIAKGPNIIKRALKTRLSAASVNWPSDFWSFTSLYTDGFGDLLTLKEGESLDKAISYQKDLRVKWSPSAEKLIFSAKDQGGVDSLFYKSLKNNGNIATLGINTNASKCVWSQDNEHVICGVTDQSSLRNEFYRINVIDGLKTLTASPNIDLTIKEMAVSRSENLLYILNGLDDRLYFIELK